MEARKPRNIKSGAQYDHLFPPANVDTETIMTNAGVGDTVSFIPKVVQKTLDHTKAIAGVLKGRNDYDTCRNIWQFVYGHIAYRKDREGYEQIRSPARSWHDRRAGVDCDCYTTFISSILTNLGIRHKLRITKYSRDYFQHIYPVVMLPDKQVIIDCVTDRFDYEVPFSEKKDFAMDLQYLNGLDGAGEPGYYGQGDMAELGRLFKKGKGGGIFKKIGNAAKKVGKGLKKIELKKVLNVINKLNPATVALRNGVLASMKLNVGNVGKRLRWSYLTPEQARAKKMDMGRWQKLVNARKKLEDIFYGAGGKPDNLKKAILHGKGNHDNAVHGFDGMGSYRFDPFDHVHPGNPSPYFNHYQSNKYPLHHLKAAHRLHPAHHRNALVSMNKNTPLRQLLGDDIFYSENSEQSLGELGEPVSMAMITAASGVIAAIASTLKKIGDVFGGKGANSADFDEKKNADAEKEIPAAGSSTDAASDPTGDGSGTSSNDNGDTGKAGAARTSSNSSSGGGASADSGSSSSSDSSSSGDSSSSVSDGSSAGEGASSGSDEKVPATQGGSREVAKNSDGSSSDPQKKNEFWDKNKKWIVPAGIGAAGLSILAIAAHAMQPPHPVPAHAKPMHGTPKAKNHHRKKTKPSHKKAVAKALM